ncbi:hypothetical protein LEP1GSC191_1031 [Leptospira borgpetersenii serovar Mini str. 201000851]|uniref:Uncharacterized protein n=2 Tax=Leptospira borgpetersenii TaxID=174 RepID=A0ABC9SFE8_LEPBO|nr:hypothetical protein LEP1GSC101_1167 [Leptospira borgpetersenii str. UI 09149]EMK09720.1 hypothetical protein LEP1GSC066_2440 [Leptospira sp. serovar Kenya str. Sh9]EMN13512.1 hypothetical protein LEP1GSC055_2991 [Leptospira borgpetersenii str. Brem 307]EMN16457.1 hypothetical protein LEP1GSC056_3231 [Leptospira borgpetersenii str. Brem 328]EMN56653.1 hypothetical protein LEP1GSC090_0281 [Leptospira borgpetersenii serovar Javanica str. MK146]ENO61752.1 hypothetical protein LEP1GSC191_1031 [
MIVLFSFQVLGQTLKKRIRWPYRNSIFVSAMFYLYCSNTQGIRVKIVSIPIFAE